MLYHATQYRFYKHQDKPDSGIFSSFLLILLIVLTFFAATAHAATTQMKHTPPDYFVADQRIQLEAKVTDDQGVKLVRCYFKAVGEADLVFVPMNDIGKNQYAGILPAPSATTTQIEYLFLAVNQANQVVRSQNFTMYKDANKETPAWQNIPKEGEIRVSIELDQAPTQLMGFSDNVTIDVVESGARFGVVALLYHTITDSDSKEAAALNSSSGTSTAAATSAASASAATGATSAGVITAGAAGWSTAAIVGVGLGVAAVAGGTAVAINSSDDDDGGGNNEPQDLTEKTITGDWNVTGSRPDGYTMRGDFTLKDNGVFTYNTISTTPMGEESTQAGDGTWTLNGTYLTLVVNTTNGAGFEGTAVGDSNAFSLYSADNEFTLYLTR